MSPPRLKKVGECPHKVKRQALNFKLKLTAHEDHIQPDPTPHQVQLSYFSSLEPLGRASERCLIRRGL